MAKEEKKMKRYMTYLFTCTPTFHLPFQMLVPDLRVVLVHLCSSCSPLCLPLALRHPSRPLRVTIHLRLREEHRAKRRLLEASSVRLHLRLGLPIKLPHLLLPLGLPCCRSCGLWGGWCWCWERPGVHCHGDVSGHPHHLFWLELLLPMLVVVIIIHPALPFMGVWERKQPL